MSGVYGAGVPAGGIPPPIPAFNPGIPAGVNSFPPPVIPAIAPEKPKCGGGGVQGEYDVGIHVLGLCKLH
jgi:hypothetical protein